MKYIAIILSSTIIISGALWYAIGGAALAISFGALLLIVVIFAAFGLGSWWSARLMERGARIALVAQTSDDKRDIAQLDNIGRLLHEGVKLGREQAQFIQPEYPALPGPQGNGHAVEGEFVIGGFDE